MYYLHIPDPSLLSDEEWASRVKELQWIRKKENEGESSILKRYFTPSIKKPISPNMIAINNPYPKILKNISCKNSILENFYSTNI